MITIQFVYTQHAKDKIDGLGLDFEEIELTIIKGRKWKEKYTEKWHANMAGLEVVFQKQDALIIVITVYEA